MSNNAIEALEQHIKADQQPNEGYDKVYTHSFFQSLIKYRPEYHYIADIITTYFKPTSIIDWGCGCGYILEKLKMNGVQDVYGIEGSKDALEFVPDSIKENVIIGDVLLHDAKVYDMAISIEVAEHLEEKNSARFVNSICNSASKYIWWSAAQIGQGGTGHINCQPLSYWQEIFEEISLFEPDWEMNYKIKQELLKNSQIAMGFSWLHSNLIVFRRK